MRVGTPVCPPRLPLGVTAPCAALTRPTRVKLCVCACNGFLCPQIEPFVTAEELEQAKKDVAEFGKEGGVGEMLHAQLVERARVCVEEKGSEYPYGHWLEEWWDNLAYLSGRHPLPWNTNVFGTIRDNAEHDEPLLHAALYVHGLAKVRLDIMRETMQPDCLGKKGQLPLCMFQFTRVFDITRVPGDPQDEMRKFKDVTHIAVIRKGQLFSVEAAREDGTPLPVPDILASLQAVFDEADRLEAAGEMQPPMCAMTYEERSKWAAAREHLQTKAINATSLHAVESAMFCVSLSQAAPADGAEAQRMLSLGDGTDLWQDKSFNIVFFKNGRLGFNGEHAMSDAPVPSRVLTEAVKYVEAISEEEMRAPPSASVAAPKHLKFDLDEESTAALASAQASAAELIENAHIEVMTFTGYGKSFIREHKLGPDSVLQMALQLAFHRDQGFFPCTYESATMRTFYHGRTETIRPGSLASNAWVLAMEDASVSREDKLSMFRDSCTAHTMYLQRCMLGRGVDRHLLGMRIVAYMEGIDMPAIFTNPAYAKATDFILSTSQMSYISNDYPGFGAPTPTSYGCCYVCALPDRLLATVTSDRRCKEKDAARFRDRLEKALADIGDILASSSKL